ncbi:MAG: phospho-sugar mutase, partial [Mycobacterium sp.]|nr:phospho-sugar mutase [Mycobacterium sp.]
MATDEALLARARAWLAEDPDPDTAAELSAVLTAAEAGQPDALAELADAFNGTLQFGTAGLRGRLGPGSNRMNRVVVARAAAGLAAYLVANGGGSVVV